MALKKQLTKEQFDALPADFKAEYKASGEVFVLDIEGDDGTDWKKKRDIEAEHRRTAETKLAKANEDLDNMRRGAIPKDDVAALEESWKNKVAEVENLGKAKQAELETAIANSTVAIAANDIATMFLAPAAMAPMIRGRLKVEITNGIPVTRVLDKHGMPSAMSLEDLKNEFKTDPSLAPVIVASKASGAGADGKEGGSAGAGGKKLKEMNDAERIALYKSDPAEFKRLTAEQNKST